MICAFFGRRRCRILPSPKTMTRIASSYGNLSMVQLLLLNRWDEQKIGKMFPGVMSLHFCWDIQNVGSQFGVNNMTAWIHPTLYQRFRLLVVVWGIFSWHTLGPLVPTEHRLNATVYLSIVGDHAHPFMTTVYHLLMATYIPLQTYSAQIISMTVTWQWVHWTPVASTVTRSQSNRAPLGCGGKGDWHHGCAADKSAATAASLFFNFENLY